MSNKYLKSLNRSQSGYASFVITFVTIIVVSLIVVAFASDSRLEQKNSLANTEATQAYYAAESGINDAYAVIKADLASNVTPPATNGCATPGSAYVNTSTSNVVNNSNVEYTCVIVNPTPNFLSKQGVQPGEGVVFPIDTNNSSNPPGNDAIKYITVSWVEDTNASLSFSGCPSNANSPAATLPNYSTYTSGNCNAPVVQLDLISGSDLSNDISSNNAFASPQTTVFLEPISYNGSIGVDTPPGSFVSNDKVFYVQCGSSSPAAEGQYACTQSIKVKQDTIYYVHLQTFYTNSTNVSITVQNSSPSSGRNLNISGSQVLIDSTGEANGQLKRIQETICDNVYCSSLSPDAAIQSTQCIDKNFTVYNGANTTPASGSGC
ncbi:MAG: hypothetical protein ACYCPS_05245 [Candidatus Saccharimonadales bacterium]